MTRKGCGEEENFPGEEVFEHVESRRGVTPRDPRLGTQASAFITSHR